jgi:hypothetical protein
MVRDHVEKRILALAAFGCSAVLLGCATMVRMPLGAIDGVLGIIALLYAFKNMRSRRRRHRYMPYTRF